MPQQLDVYRDWLQITETARPLNHYQLLRLKTFEDDAGKVRENYRKMNAHVRKYAAGEYGSQSQALLNELAKAMLCLTDAKRKAEYDITLGRKGSASGVRRSFEELLLLKKVVEPAQLKKARTLADTLGWELRDALLQQKLPGDVIFPIYAESIGLPYLELADFALDPNLLPKIPALLARQHSCAPVMVDDNQALIASPHPILPDVEEELRLRLAMPVRTVLCTPAAINDVIAKYYPKEAAVAEMQGKSAVVAPKPAPAAAGSTAASAAAAPAAAAPVVTYEEKLKRRKEQRMMALVAFNFGFMAAMIGQMLFMNNAFTNKLMLSLPVGIVAAAIGYLVAVRKS